MKHSALLLALFTSLAPVRAQAVVPSPPPAEAVRFETAVEPAPARDRVIFFAQARPEENRDRNNQRPSDPRPPGAPNPPPPPGERRESYGSGGGGGASYSTGGSSQNRIMRGDSRGRAPRPVVVTTKPLDAKELATVEEDLGIMARLLEKEIEREAGPDGLPNAMGIALTRLDGRGPSVMLLEGYGAVFTFNVRMLLTPPPARAPEKRPERPTDSPWERTRRELFGSADEGGGRGGSPDGQARRFEFKAPPGVSDSRGGGMMGFGGSGGFGDTWGGRIEQPQYDARKVEELKKSILEALKQAGNIRALKPDDYLTVVVQGASSSGYGPMEIAVETRTTTSSSTGSGPPRTETFVNRSEGSSGPRSGTLTVRAKKSEAEDFAKGKLTAEQFGKKALVNLH
jgi:hypothetical protein